jgi:hypothetical protein
MADPFMAETKESTLIRAQIKCALRSQQPLSERILKGEKTEGIRLSAYPHHSMSVSVCRHSHLSRIY